MAIRIRKRSLLPVIGILLFLYIMLNIDLFQTASILSGSDPILLALSFLLTIPLVLIRAFKWKAIISSYDVDFPLSSAAEAWLIGFFFGIVTPGRVGDLSRSYYLRSGSGVSMGKSVTTVVVDRIIDVAFLFLLGLAGLGVLIARFTMMGSLLLYVIAFFGVFLAWIFIITKRSVVYRIGKPFAVRFAPKRYRGLLGKLFNDFYRGIGEISKGRMAISASAGLASWLLSIFQYYMIALSIGVPVPFIFLFAIVPVVALLDALPISFSGLGTREAAIIFFLAMLGITTEMAVSYSLAVFFIIYVFVGLLGALLWTRKPIRL